MPEIRKLSAGMINKIAAGEVIERPASVVKELAENALDAGATRIEINVEKSGNDLIAVIDNGCGIPADQLALALSSHATSKIAETDDLFSVRSFGFRGEALASIAEISQLTLRSCSTAVNEKSAVSSVGGAEIRSIGGVLSEPVPCGTAPGTVIEVRNLFFNTPVRRKYLKSPGTEFGHLAEAVIRLAIPNIGVHFILRHNNRVVYDLPPTSKLDERIGRIFGAEISQKLISVDRQDGQDRVWGYVGHPDLSRSNYGMQYFFLNGRFIRDKSLQHALTQGYRGLLTVGRYPVAFLRLDLDPSEVDLNVHPTKLEVRFLESQRIYADILAAIREKFLRADLRSRPALGEAEIEGAAGLNGEKSGEGGDSLSSPFEETELEFSGPFSPDSNLSGGVDPGRSDEIRDRVRSWAKGESPEKRGNATEIGDFEGGDGSADAGYFGELKETGASGRTSRAEESSREAGASDLNSTSFSGKTDRFGSSSGGRSENFGHSDGRSSLLGSRNVFPGFPSGGVPSFRPFPSGKPESVGGSRSDLTSISPSGPTTPSGPASPSSPTRPSDPTTPSGPTSPSNPSGDSTSFGDSSLFRDSDPLGFSAVPGPSDSSSPSRRNGVENRPPSVAVSPSGYPVLQVKNRYLVLETEDGMAIIDQHALHERILYEKMKRALENGPLDSQRLLVPETVELSPAEAATALENRELFEKFGLKIDAFGGNTILLSAYPALLERLGPAEIFLTLLPMVAEMGKSAEKSDLFDAMLHQSACKAAVKGGDFLRDDAIGELLALAESEINAHHCPHGRPSILEYSVADIDKLFKRT